jgi:hypothetical protein
MGDNDVDVYINQGSLVGLSRQQGDLTAIPPGTTLIDRKVWAVMCSEAGGEAALVAKLALKDERRDI